MTPFSANESTRISIITWVIILKMYAPPILRLILKPETNIGALFYPETVKQTASKSSTYTFNPTRPTTVRNKLTVWTICFSVSFLLHSQQHSTTFCIILMMAINKRTYILCANRSFLFHMTILLYSPDRTHSELQNHWQRVFLGLNVE